MGAVAYDPKVVTIWDGFQQYFRSRGLAFDYVLYSNYERQVEAHLSRAHPRRVELAARLAPDRAGRPSGLGRRAEAICMRDTDRDLTSIVLVRADSGDRHGRAISTASASRSARSDSPQATLIPLNYLADQGLDAGRRLRGHGVRRAGRQARRSHRRRARRGAGADSRRGRRGVHDRRQPSGVHPRRHASRRRATRILAQTPAYDHCNFTVLDDAPAEPVRTLPRAAARDVVRRRRGPPAARSRRPEAVAARPRQRLRAARGAVDRFDTIEPFVSGVQARCR